MRKLLVLTAAAAAVAAGCDSPSVPGVQVPAQLEVVAGDDQQGVVGRELGDALVVRVLDDKGKPFRGAVVNFRVTSGGGSVFAGASLTNENGEARERWTLGTATADSQRVEVRGVDAATGQAIVFATFRATALADAPETLTALGATVRSGYAGAPLADSLAARVADRYGNGVPGSVVVWSVTGGGGTLSPAQGTTDAQGVARTSWTLGTRLDSLHTAEAAISPAVRVQFSAAAGLPMGTQLSKVSGDGQDGGVGDPLGAPLVVRLALADGRPIVGATIVWSIASGAGTLTPPTSVTGADGQAQAAWRLGTGSGPQGVVATIQSLTAIFSASAAAGAPATFAKVGGDGQTAPAGSAVADSLGVRLTDAHGNPVPGATVTWSVLRGGGSVSPAQATSDANGVARARWILGMRVDGIQSVEAETAPGLRLQFNAAATVPGGAALAVVSGNGQTAPVATALPAPVVVALRAADGRGIAGAEVTFSAAPGSGTLAPASVVTDANGHASATWTLGTKAGAATATAGTPGAASLALAATGTSGPPAALTAVSGQGQTGRAGAPLPAPLVVQVADAHGNPVAGATVQWTVVTGDGSAAPAAAATGADGTTSTTWTLGSAAGSQSIRASSGSLPTVLMTATAVVPQPIVITVRLPQPNQVVRDTLPVRAGINVPPASLRSFTAQVAGRVVDLKPVGTEWGDTLLLNGLPYGALTLRLRAEGVAGDTAVANVPFIHDVPPTVTVQAPLLNTVARPQLRIDAECGDDDPAGCIRLVVSARAPGQSVTLAEGTSGVHTTVSLPPAFDGGTVHIDVVGVDSRNRQTVVSRAVYVESSPRWTEAASGGALLLDYDAQRVLYFAADGSARTASRAGGGETVLRGPDPYPLTAGGRGWLHSQGAVFTNQQTNGNYDWRGGTLQALGGSGSSLRVAGDWAMWTGAIGYTDLFRRDLGSGATLRLATNAGNTSQSVAENGDVAFWNSSYDIMRYRDGAVTPLTSSDNAVAWNVYPVTDGTSVVFRRSAPCCAPGTHRIVMITAAGAEVVLTPALTWEPAPHTDYDASGGWVAFRQPDAAGIRQVWMRSPGNVIYQATQLGTASSIRAMGPAGELAFASGTRLYVALPPYTSAPVDVGSSQFATRLEWRGGQLVAFLGRSAFTVSY